LSSLWLGRGRSLSWASESRRGGRRAAVCGPSWSCLVEVSGRGRPGDGLAEGVHQFAGEVREVLSAVDEAAAPVQGAGAYGDPESDVQVREHWSPVCVESGGHSFQGVLEHRRQDVGWHVAGGVGQLLASLVGDLDGSCGQVCVDERPLKGR
jgi:hypothetical protein